MRITAAFLDDNFIPSDIIIGFQHVPGEHSGINLAENFYSTILSHNLQEKASSLHIVYVMCSINTYVFSVDVSHLYWQCEFKRDFYWPNCQAYGKKWKPIQQRQVDALFSTHANKLNLSIKSALECIAALIDKVIVINFKSFWMSLLIKIHYSCTIW